MAKEKTTKQKIKEAIKLGSGRNLQIPFSYCRIGKIVEPAIVDADAFKKYQAKRKNLERIRTQLIKSGRINPC